MDDYKLLTYRQRSEYSIVLHATSILAAQCAGDRDTVIKKLTGYLWDKEEETKILKLGVEK